MLELPWGANPNALSVELVDRGATMRGPSNAVRFERPGSHWRMTFGIAPVEHWQAGSVAASRLARAVRHGLRMPIPLGSVYQGLPGDPVVNGAGQSGTSLSLRGLTPDYAAQEGFWLSISNGAQRFLHQVTDPAVANAQGQLTVGIYPELRFPFADGATVELEKPVIEGLVSDDSAAWAISLAHHTLLQFTIEERG